MLRSYVQLLRLPNLFTAWADIFLGWLIMSDSAQALLLALAAFLTAFYTARQLCLTFLGEPRTEEAKHASLGSGVVPIAMTLPLIILAVFALLAGGSLFGFTGVLISVPVAAILVASLRLRFVDAQSGDVAAAVSGANFAALTPADGALLAITYDGAAAEVAAGAATVGRAAAQTAGEELPAAAAARAWDERFLALHLKRAGPSVLGTEAWLSVSQLAAYTANVARLARRQNLPIATYGMVVAPGMATVMSLFGCDDARPLAYLLALSLTGRLYEIAFRHGGRPYGIGVWNTPYLGRAFAAEELTAQRRRKQAFDPANLLNPGKRYAPPALLWPPTFRLGMAALAGIRRIGRRWLR